MSPNSSKIIFLLVGCSFLNHYGFTQSRSSISIADSLLGLMTLQEKVEMIAGYQNFNIKGNERLGIPQVKLADGPMGVKGHGKATAFPASICMAASWNPDLVKEVGTAIGREAKSKGIGILLAPGVNMYRVPHCGRNFEYYGEDPLLASEMAVGFINGVQSNNVVATVKHLVANNQDYDRHRVSSDIDERTLREIYFPVFKAAIKKADVGAVMTSYNLLNGIHTSESEYLLKDILRNDWGFDGIIMSDWISVYSTKAFIAGLDLEMPRPHYMHPDSILPLLKNGSLARVELDNKIRHILSTCIKHKLYEEIQIDEPNWEIHKQTALQAAREGIVLLKNENNILPITESKVQKVIVLGPNAMYTPYSGGGAAKIEAYEMLSFFDGIQGHAPRDTEVDYLPVEGLDKAYSQVNIDEFSKSLESIKKYDAVILCVGFNPQTEGEGFDRPFALIDGQEWLIELVTSINPNTVLVLNVGGGVFMPWLENIQALLHTWYPGQQGGNALGEIVFGKISPSGKLPISIEKNWSDNAAFETYDTSYAVPGAKPFYTLYGKPHETEHLPYNEGIFTGYRHFEKHDIKPLFPFGFGLSYTSFALKDFTIDKKKMKAGVNLQIRIQIENTGTLAGAETVQLYISDLKCSHPQPVKELKAFHKIFLEPGQQGSIEFRVDAEMLKYYNPELSKWIVENGEFEILIGTASDNIIFRDTITRTP